MARKKKQTETTIPSDDLVIPPFLEGVWRRTHPEDCTSICRLSF